VSRNVVIVSIVVACLMLAAAGSAYSATVGSSMPTTRAGLPGPLPMPMVATRLGAIQNAQLAGQLLSLCDLDGQMYGAGSGNVVAIIEDGRISRRIPVPITVPSISRYSAGVLVIGDCGKGIVYLLNVKSGQLTKLFALSEVIADLPLPTPTPARDPGSLRGVDPIPLPRFAYAASALKNPLSAAASDGKFIYVATRGGFSSSIFKIDPATKQVVGHCWAGGDDPAAMMWGTGVGTGIMVLHSSRQQIRRFTPELQTIDKFINVPVKNGRGLIIRGDEIRVVSAADKGIVRMRGDMLAIKSARHNVVEFPVRIGAILAAIVGPQKYALLICGGRAQDYWGECFWNDTVWIYKGLIAAGYAPENIYVLYGDGADYNSANPGYRYPGKVTDFPATYAWVTKVIDGMKNGDPANGVAKMKDNDTLFVWTFDHGGGDQTACLCLYNNEQIWDTDFADRLNAVPYATRAIYMQQCCSGGFIDNLKNNKTFISTACKADESAWPADTENELYNGKWYSHGEYDYYIISSINKANPLGGPVNADTSGDNKISAKESHIWEATHKSIDIEHPQMDDGGCGSTFIVKP